MKELLLVLLGIGIWQFVVAIVVFSTDDEEKVFVGSNPLSCKGLTNSPTLSIYFFINFFMTFETSC